MFLDHVILGTAVVGSVAAAAYDLKTTEVPNWVFYAMLIVGVPAAVLKIFFGGGLDTFVLSGATGLLLLGFGYLMYRFGQWGGADMVLLALIGFLVPSVSLQFPGSIAFPFGASFLFNLFMVGAVYMIFYAVVFALRNKVVLARFRSGVKASSRLLLMISASMAVLFTLLILYLNSLAGLPLTPADAARGVALPVALTVSFFLIYKFAKSVENFGFKKRIPVSKLREGDMLLDEKKLVGITRSQLARIRRSGKRHVWIKEGVRFAPAFPLALLFTLYVGDAILLIRFFF